VLVLQKPNSEKIKMIRKIVGMTMVAVAVGYTIYAVATNSPALSYNEAAGVIPCLMGGAIVATWGDSDSFAEGNKVKGLERDVTED